jgi:hypothetical protein
MTAQSRSKHIEIVTENRFGVRLNTDIKKTKFVGDRFTNFLESNGETPTGEFGAIESYSNT